MSAAQIATSFLPHFPSTGLKLCGTVFFQEIEKEKKRKSKSLGTLEGTVSSLGCTTENISFFKQISPSCMFFSTSLLSETSVQHNCWFTLHTGHKNRTGAVQGIQCIDRRREIRPILHLYPVTFIWLTSDSLRSAIICKRERTQTTFRPQTLSHSFEICDIFA